MEKKRKINRIVESQTILLTAFMLVICISCSSSIEKKVISYVENNRCLKDKDSCMLNFSDIIENRIDRLYIFGETTTENEISEIIGTPYKGEYITDSKYRIICIYDPQIVFSEDFVQNKIEFVCNKHQTDDGLIYKETSSPRFQIKKVLNGSENQKYLLNFTSN